MEIVSNKLSLTAVSAAPPPSSSPSASTRHLERKATFASSQRRWNGGTNSQRSSHGRRESLTGSSLMSLKAYYRKLRTFKGTIKALISFRRMPTFANRSSSVSGASGATLPQHTEESSVSSVEAGASKVVAKLADNEDALQTVQNQVKELVDKGHVVTELDPADKDDVTYRLQGNLEHYTEENLRKRLKLQEHPHMVALTQRLWLAANHEEEAQLSFGEYEAYMLRLHRLILPEFDLAQSKELIKDDWARDTDGSDHLDYRFFHFSMFELVDLWTDTVDAEDYISLLYCIMHCLTFKWNDRHILKDLDDVNPVDILEVSKTVTKEEIERDLAQEVNSASAQMYRDRIACEEDESAATGENDVAAIGLSDQSETHAIATTALENATKDEDASSQTALQRKSSAPHSASSASDKRVLVSRTPSSPSKAGNDRKATAGRLTPRLSTMGGDAAHGGGAGALSSSGGEARLGASQEHNPNDAAAALSGRLSPRISPTRLQGTSSGVGGVVASDFNIQGRQQGTGYSARGSSSQAGPRFIYSSGSGNQYGAEADGANSPISITSFGAGSEFINMVSKPGVMRKPSMMGSGGSYHQSEGGIGNAVFGLGLQAGQSAIAAGFAHHITREGDSTNVSAGVSAGSFPSPRQSMSTSPRTPHPPRANGKESEARQGSLVVGEQLRSPPIVYGGGYGNSSPRARSAKSQARISTSMGPQTEPSTLPIGGDAVAVTGASVAPLNAVPIDVGDDNALLIASMRSTRQSILLRPATSSPSQRNIASNQHNNGSLTDFLQTKAYQETSLKLGRPLSRASRVYQQRVSQSLVEDLAVSTLGAQGGHFTSGFSTQTRSSMVQTSRISHSSFVDSVVGQSKRKTNTTLSFDASPLRSPNQRVSMTVGAVGRIPASPRKPMGGELRLGLSLRISSPPARLELHTHSLSPRK